MVSGKKKFTSCKQFVSFSTLRTKRTCGAAEYRMLLVLCASAIFPLSQLKPVDERGDDSFARETPRNARCAPHQAHRLHRGGRRAGGQDRLPAGERERARDIQGIVSRDLKHLFVRIALLYYRYVRGAFSCSLCCF
jgi:hypothetical protein